MEKFRAYKTKAKVHDSRFNLSSRYMTEDFTVSNHKIIDKLLLLQKGKKIKKKFWTYDGKIFAKADETQPKCRIRSVGDIDKMITVAFEEGYMADPAAERATVSKHQLNQAPLVIRSAKLLAHRAPWNELKS